MAGGGIAGTGQDGVRVTSQKVQLGLPQACQPAQDCWRRMASPNQAVEWDGSWDPHSHGDGNGRAQTGCQLGHLATLFWPRCHSCRFCEVPGHAQQSLLDVISGEPRHREDCG